jgi:O-antigen/teichoic acid export membrane protein
MTALARKVAVNTSYYAAGRVAVSAAGILATAMTARFLAPENFGALTIALVFVPLMALFADLGLYVITVRELARRPDEVQRLLGNAFAIGLVLSAVSVAGALGLMALLYPGEAREPVRQAILVLCAQLVFTAPGGVATAYMTFTQRAAPLVIGAVAGSTALVAVLAVAVTTHGGFLLIASAYAAQGVLTLLVPLLFLAGSGVRMRPRLDGDLWRGLVLATLPQSAVLLLATVYFRIDTILLSLVSSDRQVALYGIAYRVLEGLIVLPVLFMATLFPELARHEPGSTRLAQILQHAFSTVLVAVIPLTIILAVFRGEVVAIVSGESYSGAGVVLAVLMVAVALNFVATVFFQTLVAVGQQAGVARAMGVVLLSNLVANAALIPPLGALGAAFALIVSDVCSTGLALRLLLKVTERPRVHRPSRLAIATVASAATALGAHAAVLDSAPAVFALMLGTLIAGGVFVSLLLILRAVPSSLEMVSAPIERRLGLR